MNEEKENVQINWTLSASQIQVRFLVFEGRDFKIVSPDLEQDDNVEDECDEDEDDAGEDPSGKSGQSD